MLGVAKKKYRATLTLAYTGGTSNEQSRLSNAQAGWDYVETSAFAVDSDSLQEVRLALEVLTRAVETPGTLSALALQVQMLEPGLEAPAAASHRKALEKLLKEPLPDRP